MAYASIPSACQAAVSALPSKASMAGLARASETPAAAKKNAQMTSWRFQTGLKYNILSKRGEKHTRNIWKNLDEVEKKHLWQYHNFIVTNYCDVVVTTFTFWRQPHLHQVASCENADFHHDLHKKNVMQGSVGVGTLTPQHLDLSVVNPICELQTNVSPLGKPSVFSQKSHFWWVAWW